MDNSPYLPDLSSCDLFMLPNKKFSSKLSHFKTPEDIQGNVTTVLKGPSGNYF
jgi:hypothetical protein